MNKTTITVDSITYAIKLKKLLNRKGIESELTKVSRKENQGCTHGVIIERNDLFSAISIMREKGIDYGVIDQA